MTGMEEANSNLEQRNREMEMKIAELTQIGGELADENEKLHATVQNLEEEKKSWESKNRLLDANFNKVTMIWGQDNAKIFELQTKIEKVNF